ncbi:PIN domain-containing protein [Alsobacter sp. SYSU BS001988]
MRVLLDTNILIDFLNDVEEARAEIHRYADPAISIITWIEVLVGTPEHLSEATRLFMSSFNVIEIRPDIADEAVRIRQSHKLKLPDSVIWATARAEDRLFVTRNTKDFPSGDDRVRVPYKR